MLVMLRWVADDLKSVVVEIRCTDVSDEGARCDQLSFRGIIMHLQLPRGLPQSKSQSYQRPVYMFRPQ